MCDKDQKRKMVNLLFESMNSRDFSRLSDFIAADIVFNFPGAGNVDGSKRVLIFLKTLLRKFPELTFTVSEIIVENERAVAVWTNAGESSSGKEYSNSGITLFNFEGDKITFISDYFKDTSFIRN